MINNKNQGPIKYISQFALVINTLIILLFILGLTYLINRENIANILLIVSPFVLIIAYLIESDLKMKQTIDRLNMITLIIEAKEDKNDIKKD